MKNNPQVVRNIRGSGSDPLAIPFSVGEGAKLVLPKFLWDTVEIVPDEPITEHRFFSNVVGNPGVSKIMTNNEGAGRVPRGRIWVLTEIGFTLHTGEKVINEGQESFFDVFLSLLRLSTIFELEIDKRIYLESPLWKLMVMNPPIHNSTTNNYNAELFAPQMEKLTYPIYMREETLWNAKIVNPSELGLLLPRDVIDGSVFLQIMFKGREYISVDRP